MGAGYSGPEHTAALVAAIVLEIAGAAECVESGHGRRFAPIHGLTGLGPTCDPSPRQC